MRKIKKIELEKEIITCDTCGIDFEEDEHNTFECMVCHKDVCGTCTKIIQISFNPISMYPSLLKLCPHCFETLTLKKLEELAYNEK
jgi:hypothetical protein